MDLVDDDGVDVDERLAHPRRQHEIEALGRGDEQIRWVACEALALAGGRVTGAHRHHRFTEGNTEPFGRERDPRERRSQVLLHVEGECAQR